MASPPEGSDGRSTLAEVAQVLADIDDRSFQVEGHTDDVPIATARFRSNWALSSARAVSVAHGLFGGGELAQGRFTITGHADTKPLVSNANEAGRARNRRVEIVIHQGLSEDVQQELEVLRAENPAAYNAVRQELIERFELSPDEIF